MPNFARGLPSTTDQHHRSFDGVRLAWFTRFLAAAHFAWFAVWMVHGGEVLTSAGLHVDPATARGMGFLQGPLLTRGGMVAFAAAVFALELFLVLRGQGWWACAGLSVASFYLLWVDAISTFTITRVFVISFTLLAWVFGFRHRPGGMALRDVDRDAVLALRWIPVSVYFLSGWAKAIHGDWLIFSDTLWTQVQGVYRTAAAGWALERLPTGIWTIAMAFTLGFELGSPIFFHWRRVWWVAVLSGLMFHGLIAVLMKGLILFSLQFVAFYVLFLPDGCWRWFLDSVPGQCLAGARVASECRVTKGEQGP